MRQAVCTIGLVLTLLLAGCGQSSPPANIEGVQPADAQAGSQRAETFPWTIGQEAEYYTSGPQQGRPPDGKLAVGTKVNVLRRTGGYSLVRTETGVEGYILSDAIHDPASDALR